MPETATPTKVESAAPATKAPTAPEAAAPDLAPDAAVQATVESFRHAGTSGVAGGAASGGAAGGGASSGSSRWTPRPAVGARDLAALQRMAGNRAVSALVGRRSGGTGTPATPAAGPALQRQPAVLPVQRDGPTPAQALQAPGGEHADAGAGTGAGKLDEARAMVVRADTAAKAAADMAAWARNLKDLGRDPSGQAEIPFVVMTLAQTELTLYDRNAVAQGSFKLELPKGTSFAEGVFVTPPGAGISMRMRLDPKMKRFRPYENAAILQEIEPKPAGNPKAAVPGAGAAPDVAPAAPASDGGANGGAATGRAFDRTGKQSGFDLKKYMKDSAGFDAVSKKFQGAYEFLVVRTPTEESSGTGKGKGGPRSTGFGGELEGHGTPPNRPPWPVTMDGPKSLPIGGQGTFAATINWAAESSNTISMVTAQMGNEILYRWELFDITAQARKEAEKEAARAQQAKEAIAALMGTQAGGDAGAQEAVAVRGGLVAGLTGKPAASAGGPSAGAGKAPAKGAAAIAPPKPKAVGSPDDKSLADEILERQTSRAGSGADQNGITAGADFERDYASLWGDTKRTWSAVGESKKESWLERRSDDVANVTAVALLPISGVITTLGATFRYANEQWSGDRQQQDIPMAKPGTYLVRVIATPRVQVTPNGEQIIRPSSVAVQTVQVVEMEKMVGDALRDPGTKLKEAQNALDAAKKGGKEDAIKAAQAQFDSTKLEVEGDPLELLDQKVDAKQRDLDAARAKWEKLNIHGPIIDLENQLETLKKRRDLYKLQEERRVSQLKSEGRSVSPPIRVNATLASELTGQGYPLLISVGNMGMAGTKHRWKVLDATSKKAEGFEGVGDTASEAIENAFEDFAKDAQYGKGIIGVQLPKALMDQLEPGSKADRRYTSAPAGWAVARGRIDDLVMTLAAIGLFVASAGTGAAILGGVVAAAKLIHRLHAGTLELDVEAISDVLAIFGAVAATAQSVAKGAQAAAGAAKVEAEGAKAVHIAGLRAQPLGNMFVLAPETAAVESNLAKASAALARAGALAQRVEWANEALGYAGLVWGNATFLMSMADIASQEATGAISHSEARRQRANAIGGAIQNNGMFIAGNAIKAKQAAKAAKAASAATSAHTEPSATTTGTADHPTATAGGEAPGGKPAAGGEPGATSTSGATKEAPSAGTDAPTSSDQRGIADHPAANEHPPGEKPATADEHPTKGGATDDATGAKRPPEPTVPEGQPKPGELAAGASESAAPKPAENGPQPGSRKAKAAARKLLEGVITGETPPKGVEDAIKLGRGWKDVLKAAVGKLKGEAKGKAQEALVAQREAMVNETWAAVKKAAGGKYDSLRLENAGTKSFSSDIDATVRPHEGHEAGGTGQQMADQIKLAAEAAQAMSKALRERIGGGETDVVIDTNIYSFIGEGRIKPTDAKAKGAQQHVDIMVGLAEQLRGQNEAQFKAFEARLKNLAGDPRVQAEAKALLAEARQFHDARVSEWAKAVADARVAEPKIGEAAQNRTAREAILGLKKQELSGLMRAESPNHDAIARKQAEINWFAPDAYATPSAFKQAVAHGQRLKGAPAAAEKMKGDVVGSKLREAAARLPEDNPRAAKLKADAELVENQQKLLDATTRELEQVQHESPMDSQRVDDLNRRAERVREAIRARAEKVIVAELFGETAPGDKPGPEQLSESAAASGANMGMLEDHVHHAKDLDGKVKAAAKYAARIAMAEWLSGLRPSGDAIARLLNEFVKSRWDINADIAPEMLRDMFLRYAELTGGGNGVVHDRSGVAVGVTDAVKQAFVDDASSWARQTNDGIQAAAIGAKTFDNPTAAAISGSGADAAVAAPAAGNGPGGSSAGGAGGAGGGGRSGGSGGGSGSIPPPSSGGDAPAPSSGPQNPPGGGSASSDGAAPVPVERPTMPVPAPVDDASGPATRRDGAGNQQPARTGNADGPARGPNGERTVASVADIPGGIVVKSDPFATVVSVKNEPRTFVRLQVDGNAIRLTDIFKGSMPAGTGTVLLAEALKEVKAASGNELVIQGIINPETLAAHEANQAPDQSKLGRVGARGLQQAGYGVGSMRWETVGGKLALVIEIK